MLLFLQQTINFDKKKTEFKFGYAVNGVKFISISESFVELPGTHLSN